MREDEWLLYLHGAVLGFGAGVLHETLGLDWMTPELWRFGASSLLNDVLMQLRKQATGAYQGLDYFTID